MKKYIHLFLSVFILLNACNPKKAGTVNNAGPLKVEIRKVADTFRLYTDDQPYFIKGAVGWGFLEELTESGANSVRSSSGFLDEAHRKGLTVLVNLPMGAERNGFDYNDEQAVKEQYLKNKEIVEEYKDHPALLMWAIGNELDHIPGDKDYNLKVWDAIDEIAGMIKETDPNHPVMTVVGLGKLEKIRDIRERCPNLDLLGVNAYAALLKVPDWLLRYGWDRPYVVTEWGPSGWWEVPVTRQGVVIEETSTEKAGVYRERYEKVILGDPLCLGSYVFLWTTNRQERTHTWFNMFHDSLKTGTVEVMQYMWTGKWPANRTPKITSLSVNTLSPLESIEVAPSSINTASVEANDTDNDELAYEWELLPEPTQFGAYAGQGEKKPEPVGGFIRNRENGTIRFQVPADTGKNYRLFVYIRDGHGNIAVANVPFYVGRK
jgi:Cellulase (glycosyl hydrolase family 5)